MTKDEIKSTLADHAEWLKDSIKGKRANLQGADLHGADLRSANLQGADLQGADLRSADLYGANLYGANLRNANLHGADLRSADLHGADLHGANLPHFSLVPEEGDFIAWKKVRGAVLKLRVTGVRVSSLVGRKCRASEVFVIEADTKGETFESLRGGFTYTVGQTAKVENLDTDIRIECTTGIHFFMTRREAETYDS